MIDNNFAAPNNQLTFSINPKNRFVMAENSLQNQKNEVSFVLSEKAKAIIEKFEKQIENRSENDKNELRIDLLMLLLKRLHPEVLSADAKGLFAEIYCLNNKTTDKNTGFLMHCFSENELNNLSNDFNSIWSYYCSMFSIEGIPTIDDYQELLLCESLMPDGKRRLVVTFSFFTLINKPRIIVSSLFATITVATKAATTSICKIIWYKSGTYLPGTCTN